MSNRSVPHRSSLTMALFVVMMAMMVLSLSSKPAQAFHVMTVPGVKSISSRSSTGLWSSSTADDATSSSTSTATTTTPNGLLKRDRYVATNRFAVRPGREGKFEQRWATRKSRLATLDGFRYFHLMRRVTWNDDDVNDGGGTTETVYDGGDDKESRQGNYVSFTIWEKKSDFSAWRNGEAFKEAHGGTSIGAFLSTMVNSALILQGPPRPAFYDGLLVQSVVPDAIPETVDGWRKIDVDSTANNGSSTGILPTECFVACNQFFVPSEHAAAFEMRWASRESKLQDCDGFVAFSMLRRDGQQKGHGTVPIADGEPTYMSTTIWRDRASFDAWRKGSAFQHTHGRPQGKEDGKVDQSGGTAAAQPPLPLWSRPPKPVFYEGTLVISSKDGA